MEQASQQERSHLVVISVAEDNDLRDELEQHLIPLVRKNKITLWDSRDIPVGTPWQEAYQSALEKASAVLLLLSAKFLADDQCYQMMQEALDHQGSSAVRVFPILLRPVSLEDTPLHQLECLPRGGKPIIRWTDPDEAFQEIVDEIRKAIISIQHSPENLISHQKQNKILQDRARLDWDQRLIVANSLRPESLKLGDAAAATFPYIINPIQEVYNMTIQAIQDASTETKRTKEGILLLGESNAGKTRLAFESIRKMLPDWHILRCWPDYTMDDIPPMSLLEGKFLVLLIEDLQDYVPFLQERINNQSLIVDHRTVILRRLLETLHQVAQQVVVVATCRTEDSMRVQTSLNWLFTRLKNIVIPSFNEDSKDPKVAQAISEFEAQGTIHIEDWDGTLGSLVLGLSTKNSQYLDLIKHHNHAAIVLKAMKLLTLGDTKLHTDRRLKTVCIEVFGERQFLENERLWQESINQLTRLQFVHEELDIESQETILIIRKDAYFEKVITDYPSSYRPHQIERDFIKLRKVFVALKDVQLLLNLGDVHLMLRKFEEALRIFDCVITIDPDNVEAWIRKGVPYIISGGPYQPSLGLKAFDHALALNPNNANAWLFKGTVLGELDLHEDALVAFDHAIRLNPDDIYAWLFKGSILGNLKRYKEAYAAIDHVFALNPTKTSIWYNYRGTILLNQERYNDALVAFDQAISLEPDTASAWHHKSIALEKTTRLEEALISIDHSIDLDPNNAKAWFSKGSILETLERYDDSLDAIDHALALDPGKVDVWSYKGIMFKNLNSYDDALVAFNHALALDSMQPSIWYNKGVVLSALERYDDALAAFDRALAIDPHHTDAWCFKGVTSMTLQQFKDALDAFNYALSLDPDNIAAWYHKSIVLGVLTTPEETLTAINHALTLDPANAQAWSFKGRTLGELERYEDALDAIDHALSLDPDDATAWYHKSIVLGVLATPEETLTAINHALALDPANAQAWSSKGQMLNELERYEDALDAIDHALSLDPANAQAWSSKGQMLNELERYEDALDAIDHALSLDPANAQAWSFKGQMLNELERYEDALDAIDHALSLDMTMIKTLSNTMGLIFSYLGRYAEAIKSYEQAIKEDPDNFAALYNSAVVTASWQGISNSRAYVEQARSALLVLVDTDAKGAAFYGLGGLEALVGNNDQALYYLNQAISFEKLACRWARHDIAWLKLHKDQRFQALILESDGFTGGAD